MVILHSYLYVIWLVVWNHGFLWLSHHIVFFHKQLLSWMGFSILVRNGLCSLMICWLLQVPAGVPSPLFSLLWFRCLSPFFSLLSFLRTGVLFHHDLLVPPGSGWGSGACLPSSLFFGSGACLPSLFFLSSGKGFCSIMICWFLLVPAGVPLLVSLILSSLVPVLVSLLLSSFFSQDRGSVPSWFAGSSWFRLGFRCLSPFFSLLWFRCLSPFSLLSFLRKGVLFHHDLLVPPGSGWGSVSLILSSLVPVLVSLLLSSFFPQDRGSVPSWFAGSSWFRLGFRCLSPFFSLLWFRCLSPFSLLSFLRKGVLFHHDLLVPPGSGWGSAACLPYSLFFGSGACLPSSLFFLFSGQGFCSIMICWFLLVPAGVPVLVSLLLSSLVPVLVSLLSSFFPQERGSVPSWFAGSSWFRLGFRCLSPFFSLLFFLNRSVPDSSMNFELHMTLVETCVVAVWGLCWCIFFIIPTDKVIFFRGVETINQCYLPHMFSFPTCLPMTWGCQRELCNVVSACQQYRWMCHDVSKAGGLPPDDHFWWETDYTRVDLGCFPINFRENQTVQCSISLWFPINSIKSQHISLLRLVNSIIGSMFSAQIRRTTIRQIFVQGNSQAANGNCR